MSKLYNNYKVLKSKDNTKLYLFKSGKFYIFIDEDAKYINKITTLKLSSLTKDVMKSGFPDISLEKYKELFKNLKLDIVIINNIDNQEIINKKIINKILNIDIDNITPVKALVFLKSLKDELNG